MTTLLQGIAAKQHTPIVEAYLNGIPVTAETQIVEVPSVDFDIDSHIAEARIKLRATPSWFQQRQTLEIRLGWAGCSPQVLTCFKGIVPERELTAGPAFVTLLAQGYMSKAEAEVSGAAGVLWSSQTDIQIVQDCLTAVGITAYELDGDGTVLGTLEDVELKQGQAYSSLISEIDECELYYTVDCPDAVVRRRLFTGVPTGTAAFAFVEGVNIIGEPKRNETVRGQRNQVKVDGHPDGEGGIGAYGAQQGTAFADPPLYRVFTFQSPLIETDAVATAVAQRLMLRYNREVETITLRTPGNPYLMPFMTISITSTSLGLTSATNYTIRRLSHSVTAGEGWVTELTVEGGVGDAGFALGRPPVAMFTPFVERETVIIGGVRTTIYVVNCINGTVDLDSPPDTVTLAWTNNINADTGTGQIYSTYFTQAEMDGSPTPAITLVATDGDANSDSVTQEISETASDIIMRQLHHAFYGRAESTSDGGLTWQTWAPGGGEHIICTPPIAPFVTQELGQGWYGGDLGNLYLTQDFLVTVPTLIHTFPSAINSVQINETDPYQGSVGLNNGDVWHSSDLNLLASSTWIKLRTFDNPVVWVEQSALYLGQYRVCSGANEWLSDDSLATIYDANFWPSGTATKTSPSFFGNYSSAIDTVSGEDHPVKIELVGTPVTFPLLAPVVNDVRALTHDILRSLLYALDRPGRTFASDADAAFVQRTSVPGATGINQAIRDGDLPDVIFACDETAGLMKTIDGMVRWFTLRVGNGTTLQSRMVGYGALPLEVTLPIGKKVYFGLKTQKIAYFDPDSGGWEWRSTGLGGGGYVTAITSDAVDISIMYCVCSGDVYFSTDAGLTWTSTGWPSSLGASASCNDVSCNSTTSGEVWASVDDVGATTVRGTYRSTDGGATWVKKDDPPSIVGLYAASMSVSAVGLRIWVGYDTLTFGQGGKVGYSLDGGATWTYLSYTIDWVASGHYLAVQLAREGTNFVLAWQQVTDLVWVPKYSTNNGVDWVMPTTPYANLADTLRDIHIVGDGSTIYWSTKAKKIYKTIDSGALWSDVHTVAFTPVAQDNVPRRGFYASRDGSYVYTGGQHGQFSFSLDGGATWADDDLLNYLSGTDFDLLCCHIAQAA